MVVAAKRRRSSRQIVEQLRPGDAVDAGEWLVEQRERRRERQRPGDAGALGLAGRELMGRAVEQGGDAALASGLGDAPVTLGGRHPLHLKAE